MNKDRENARKHDKTVLQWHPAFFADIQIELQEDADSLILRMSINWEQNLWK